MSFSDTSTDKVDTDDSNQQDDQAFLTVGDRTFATPEDVTKKIENADSFIEKLKAENAEKDARTEKLLDKVTELLDQKESSSKVDDLLEQLNRTEQATPDSTVNSEQIVETVLSELTAKEQAALQDRNLESAMSKAKEKFGDTYINTVRAKAEELGLTLEDVDQIAKTQPKLFDSTFIGATTKGSQIPGATVVSGALDTAPAQETTKPFLKMSSRDRAKAIADRMAALNID